MNKLLRANFARLKKDKVFWIGMAFMFAAGVFSVVQKCLNDPTSAPDPILFIFPVLIGLVSAAFTSLYIGTEYSDGTIRNKLIIGHKRGDIYLSNLITCSAAGILMCLSYMTAVAALGIPLLGPFKMKFFSILVLALVSFAMVIATAALFTLLCMLNQNKASAAVVCILFAVALLVLATSINNRLDAAPYYYSYTLPSNSGEQSDTTIYNKEEKVPNPQYLEGTKREAYQFFLDFLPTGQAIEISGQETPHIWQMPLYSLCITLLSTVCGTIVFRKKDLK